MRELHHISYARATHLDLTWAKSSKEDPLDKMPKEESDKESKVGECLDKGEAFSLVVVRKKRP